MKYGGVMVFLFFLISLILAGPVILLIYGKEYMGAAPIFNILIGAHLCVLLFVYLGQIFYLLGIHNILAAVWVVKLLVCITGFLFLIPRYGGIGAAYSTLLSYVIGLVILIAITNKVVSKLPEGMIVKSGFQPSPHIED